MINKTKSSSNAMVVTGGASAIGHALSAQLAEQGHNVVITYNNDRVRAENCARKIGEESGVNAIAVQYDLKDPRAAVTLLEFLKDKELTPRGLVHNAVVWPGRGYDESKATDYVNANVSGTLRLLHEFMPRITEQRGGRIVLISSNIATDGMAGSVIYGAVKASLYGACRSLAWEVGPQGTTVNVVAPGLTQTERVAAIPALAVKDVVAHTPTGQLVDPMEIAAVVAFLCSPEASGVTGECIRVTGGY